MPNLVLIGFMGAGKTTVGRHCARTLGFRFRDTDYLVERWAGKSIGRVFAEDGEAEFRRLECAAVRALTQKCRLVISTGGGAVLNHENVGCLRKTGILVLLTASPAVILSRTSRRGTRPLLAGHADPLARVRELLELRTPIYEAVADDVVDSSFLAPEEAAERVLGAYRARADQWPAPTAESPP